LITHKEVDKIVRELDEEELIRAARLIRKKVRTKTICGTIREIYRMAGGNKEIQQKCIEVFAYAKRMNKALRIQAGLDEGEV